MIFDSCNQLYTQLFSHSFWIFAFFISLLVLFIAASLVIAIGITRKGTLASSMPIPRLHETPMISVIMCCKGTHSESYNNFCRNLSMDYPGSVEFIFVVESATDAAKECAERAIAATEFREPLKRSAKIEIAGLSFHNAQKIHNMVHGVTCCDPNSEYVLFADDDVFFYPGLIDELLLPLVDEPDRVILSTGYEFIAPEHGASIANYCLLLYRMHNLFSFINDRPVLCWGGCWFAPIRLFKENFGNLVDCYLDGGYSDDTIISCIVQQKGFVCAHPYRATFPNQPDPNLPIKKYYEFMKRQMFVLDTYSTGYNKHVVHSLAFLICSSIWLMVIWGLLSPITGVLAIFSSFSSNFVMNSQAIASILSLFVWAAFMISLKWSTNVMLKVSNSVRPPSQQVETEIVLWKLFLGVCIHIFLLPVALVSIMLNESIVWSGVTYSKKNGKIYKVERKLPDGTVLTDSFSNSISKAITKPEFVNFMPSSSNKKALV